MSTIIEQNLDVLIAIHDADFRVDMRKERRRIVEFVRDGLGAWAVWS